MKISIRWALILGILVLIWGTYLVTTTSTYVSSERVLIRHARNVMENIAELAMQQSQNHLAHAHGAAALTRRLLSANVVGSNEKDLAALEQYFLDQLAIYPHFAGIYFGKPNGDFFYVSRNDQHSPGGFRTKIIRHANGKRTTRLLWRTKEFARDTAEWAPDDRYDPRLRPWYQKALKHRKIVWTDPYIFFTSKKPGITIAGPAFNAAGQLKGIVGVDIEIHQLSTFIAHLKIGKNGRAFMINNNGDVVAFPDLTKIQANGTSSSPAKRLVKINELDDVVSRKAFEAVQLKRGNDRRYLIQRPIFAQFEHEGKTHHAMLTPFSIAQWPWIIGVHLPEDDYLGALKHNRKFNTLLTLAISVLATLIALIFARSITRPISNLEKAALAVKNRDMRSRFDIDSKYKELQETADAFIRMKEAIRVSQEKYQGIFENMQDVYYETTLDGDLLEISPSIEKITQYSRSEALGNNVLPSYVNPEDRKRFIEALMKDGKVLDYEIQIKDKDGRTIYCSLNSVLMTDASGQPEKIIGSIRDVTDRKRDEKELQQYREHLEELVNQKTADLVEANQKLTQEVHHRRQTEAALGANEEKYRNILETIEEGYFETDLNGIFTFINHATARILNRSRNEVLGTNIKKYISSDSAKELFQIFKRIFASKTAHQVIKTRIVREDKTHRFVELTAYLIRDPLGNPAGFRGFGWDVTDRLTAEKERETMERRLQQLQRLEAIGTLAGGVAHDFNNLLMGMQANISLLLLEIDKTHLHYERVKNIEQCVKSGAHLTRQLLGYARGGKYIVKPTDLNKTVKKTARLFGRTRKEITIHGEYQPDIWAVEVDQGQIEQVLVNLYLNAYQAMDKGGDMYLQTENVTLEESFVRPFDVAAGSYVKISVRDTGSGIDPDIQERIFEPFFSTKEMGRGTGLGLASAFGIVKNHGGIIDFDSSVGRGTSFFIYLPRSKERVDDTEAPPEFLRKGAETILLVDDEAYILNGCQSMLEKMGYTVMIAHGGREAVEIHRKNKSKIDLVILDMIMPDMDGRMACDAIKAHAPDARVILSSGYSMENMAEGTIDRDCDGFIQKPYDLSQLSQKIRDVLDVTRQA